MGADQRDTPLCPHPSSDFCRRNEPVRRRRKNFKRLVSSQDLFSRRYPFPSVPTRRLPPRAQHRITRRRRHTALLNLNQLPPHQPPHRRLHRTLRNPNVFRQFPVTNLHLTTPPPRLRRQPHIHQKTHRPTVMPYQIPHQHIENVIVQGNHSYTSHSYSNNCLIAIPKRPKLSSRKFCKRRLNDSRH